MSKGTGSPRVAVLLACSLALLSAGVASGCARAETPAKAPAVPQWRAAALRPALPGVLVLRGRRTTR